MRTVLDPATDPNHRWFSHNYTSRENGKEKMGLRTLAAHCCIFLVKVFFNESTLSIIFIRSLLCTFRELLSFVNRHIWMGCGSNRFSKKKNCLKKETIVAQHIVPVIHSWRDLHKVVHSPTLFVRSQSVVTCLSHTYAYIFCLEHQKLCWFHTYAKAWSNRNFCWFF